MSWSTLRHLAPLWMLLFALTARAAPAYMTVVRDEIATTPPEGKAFVTFLRPSVVGKALPWDVWTDDLRFLGRMVGASRIRAVVEPGEHLFIASSENQEPLQATLVAGKHYFVLVEPTMGALIAQVRLVGLGPTDDRWSKVDRWLKRCKPLAPQGTEGQAWIDGAPAEFERRLAQARARLAAMDPATRDAHTLHPADGR